MTIKDEIIHGGQTRYMMLILWAQVQTKPILTSRVLFSRCKILRENLYTNQRFSLCILHPEKRTLLTTSHEL
jgi:hypothetical protein